MYGRDGQSLKSQGSLDSSGMHRGDEGDDSDNTVEDLDGAEDYLSDRWEEEEAAEEPSEVFPRLVALAVLQNAIAARRRLTFDPLGSTSAGNQVPSGGPTNMATARQDMRVKFRTFSGKSKEDPDCHVSQYETRWQARGFAGVYDAQAMMRQFEATLDGKAMQWFSNSSRSFRYL